jgi:hypothetical protein
MTPAINAKMASIRLQLEAASGPEHHAVGAHSHFAGEPGVGEADNIPDANDAVDKYLADIADQLVLVTGMDEDEALELVFDHADRSSEDGRLPALPSDDADPEELAGWLGKANTMGFGALVLKAARGA